MDSYAHVFWTGRRGIATSGVQRLPIVAQTDIAMAVVRSQDKA